MTVTFLPIYRNSTRRLLQWTYTTTNQV